jgi:CSLREA domain-containing protein
VSQRSIRRAQQRRLLADQRRETLRRRRALIATGAAIGATALFAPSALAAPLEVTTLSDAPADACDTDCTLRDAIEESNGNAEADTITFKSDLSGTLLLTQGQLALSSADAVTITGPGRDVISISGDSDDSGTNNAGDTRVLGVVGTGPATISGLTLTRGFYGALYTAADTDVTVTDSAVTNSVSATSGGGIVAAGDMTIAHSRITANAAAEAGGGVLAEQGSLKISDSLIAGNTADSGGGVRVTRNDTATIADTEISDNHVGLGPGPSMGAGIESRDGALTVTGSTISGNISDDGGGGGISHTSKYALEVSDTLITGNEAPLGGGMNAKLQYSKYETNSSVTRTTISDNKASGAGAGVYFDGPNLHQSFTISHSTISSNKGGPGSFGGGLMFGRRLNGSFDLVDSTVSGNTAGTGGGVSVGYSSNPSNFPPQVDIAFDNSTIASNSATTRGGGIYLGGGPASSGDPVENPTVSLAGTIVADNSAAGSPQDLNRLDGSTSPGAFDLSFSLVENPGDAPVSQSPDGSSIVGVDPQLGPLADNGGPTETHLPAQASAVVDKGDAPRRLATDQRGEKRTVDSPVKNVEGGNGTDIGAIEIQSFTDQPGPMPEPPTPNPPTPPARDLAPRALIKKNGLRARRDSRRVVSGVATDDREVVKVEISIVSKRGRVCRDLRKSGRFSKRRRCGKPRVFLQASGTKKWSFRLASNLRPGYYVVYARATDDMGHVQKVFDTKNRRPFRIRQGG